MPETGVTMVESSPIHLTSGVLDDGKNKKNGNKHPLLKGSSAHPINAATDERPCKMSCKRGFSLRAPVSGNVEAQKSSRCTTRARGPHMSNNADDKSGSRSEKMKACKNSSQALHAPSCPPDFSGGLDDDHEELQVAANYARNASIKACSGPFWKHMEHYFRSISSEDVSFLKHQLNLVEDLNGSFYQMFDENNNAMGFSMHTENPTYPRGHSQSYQVETDGECGGADIDRVSVEIPPLYQRVLSALIECDDQNEVGCLPIQSESDGSLYNTCPINRELRDVAKLETEIESEVNMQTQNSCMLDIFLSNMAASPSNSSMPSSLRTSEQWKADYDLSYAGGGSIPGIHKSHLGPPHSWKTNVSVGSSSGCQNAMLSLDERLLVELETISLYPKAIPQLADDAGIDKDIRRLQMQRYQQVKQIRKSLVKVDKSVGSMRDVEKRNMEDAAMNHLIEMAYKKRMVHHGGRSSKPQVRRVSPKVASGFAKRTLDRCQIFEDTGQSCFGELAFQEVLCGAPLCRHHAKSGEVGSRAANCRYQK